MPVPRSRQFTYILRVWREDADTPWRAAVQSAATGDRTYFAALEDVCRFLHTLTGATPAVPTASTHDDTSFHV
ncbi:hypothetical protein TFLX_01429 [Thermoflexales bacterium]|nr:hypothetical protein TFLX_01429 [Thermoflexales bacterium]